MQDKLHLLTNERDFFQEDLTFGKMYFTKECENKVYFGETLEDTVRAKGVKVYGKTAIPHNDLDSLYDVDIITSARFGEVVVIYTRKIFHRNWTEYILERDSISFSMIYVHGGNTEKDTLGCILVAKNRLKNAIQGTLKKEFVKLVKDLKKTGEVKLLITNKVQNEIIQKAF